MKPNRGDALSLIGLARDVLQCRLAKEVAEKALHAANAELAKLPKTGIRNMSLEFVELDGGRVTHLVSQMFGGAIPDSEFDNGYVSEPDECVKCGSTAKMDLESVHVSNVGDTRGWMCSACGHVHLAADVVIGD